MIKIAPGYVFAEVNSPGLEPLFGDVCRGESLPGAQPYRITYTGFKGLDDLICGPTGFFEIGLNPHSLPSILYFTWTHASTVLIPMVEAKRPGALFPLTFPLVWWQVYQFLSMGATMPWYFLFFVVSQFIQSFWKKGRDGSGRISGIDAESIVVAFVIGDILPFIGMFCFDSVWLTGMWQLFPLIMGVVQTAYIPLRKAVSSRRGDYGLKLLEGFNYSVFVVSAIGHWAYIFPLLKPFTKSLTTREAVEYLLKWDIIFGYGANLLGSMWFAESFQDVVGLGLWNIIGTLAVGPGAVLAATSIWRERRRIAVVTDKTK